MTERTTAERLTDYVQHKHPCCYSEHPERWQEERCTCGLADLLDGGSAWQPIETAPERKKVIVSWVNALGHRRTTFAAFYPAGTLELDEAPDDMLNEDGTNVDAGWFESREAGDAVDWHLNEKLTHWMPLPTPPTTEKP